MKSVEELREFFRRDRYATDATGIEILEAGDGYAKVGLAVRKDRHMNAGDRVMGAVDIAKAVRKGRRTSFYAAEIRDELGTLVATVSSTGFTMES